MPLQNPDAGSTTESFFPPNFESGDVVFGQFAGLAVLAIGKTDNIAKAAKTKGLTMRCRLTLL